MTLRLSVVSEHGTRLGKLSSKVFGVHGGTIGRGTDNEWSLPDPERYLSGKHVRIDFRAGTYVLVDTSSNGVYINGSQLPLGKYHDYHLKDGDIVRLGEYELLASIEASNDFPPDESAIVAYDGRAASSSVSKSTANDLNADLDLSELLESGDAPGGGSKVRARDSHGRSAGPQRDTSPDDDLPEAPPATPWHMMTRPLNVTAANGAAGPAPRGPAPAQFDAESDAGLAAFCRGAGVDPRNITPEARASALHLAGQLLRESVLGLMDLNHGHHDFRHRFRLPAPAADGPESPLNFSHGVDEALVRLLTTLSKRAGPVEAIRENFRELKAQHVASHAAMHAAFEEFLGRVDPKELEERFDRGTKRGVFGAQNRAKYWDLYAEMFAGLAQRPADGFPHLFNEAFGKAYEARLRKLIPPRRSSFGADRDATGDPDQAVGGS